jgi:hypothetical protein
MMAMGGLVSWNELYLGIRARTIVDTSVARLPEREREREREREKHIWWGYQ